MRIEEMTGDIIEKTKAIEYYFNNVIQNFVIPQKNIDFFRGVILHASIIPIASKFKIIKSICASCNLKPDFDDQKIHRILTIRNIFAHQSTYVEHPENISKIDELGSDGKFSQTVTEKLYLEFDKLYHDQIDKIIKFSEYFI